MMKSAMRRLFTALPVLLLLGMLPVAHALNAPKGKAILTISGKVADTNKDKTALFDLAMIEALPQKTFTTKTPWDNQPIKFTGPLLRDVLAAVKANGTNIKAVAVNDYKISIPVEDAQKFDMVVAHRMNDKSIPVRTKGPLFIVYPFDAAKELQSSTYYERSIWQLKAIEVE
jgi:hypothetical protein